MAHGNNPQMRMEASGYGHVSLHTLKGSRMFLPCQPTSQMTLNLPHDDFWVHCLRDAVAKAQPSPPLPPPKLTRSATTATMRSLGIRVKPVLDELSSVSEAWSSQPLKANSLSRQGAHARNRLAGRYNQHPPERGALGLETTVALLGAGACLR